MLAILVEYNGNRPAIQMRTLEYCLCTFLYGH